MRANAPKPINYAGPRTDARPVRFWETRPFEVAIVILMVLVLIGLVLPFLSGHTDVNYHGLRCQSNLHTIGQLLLAYAHAHSRALPPTLREAVVDATQGRTGRSPELLLTCPGFVRTSGIVATTAEALRPDDVDGGSPAYAYLGRGLTLDAPSVTVLAHDRNANHRAGSRMNFLYLGGLVVELDAATAAKVLEELRLGHNPPREEKLK